MKQFITILFSLWIIIILSSCASPERKVKKAILEDLKLTLHDFKSYEPVQFGKLEAAFSEFEDLPEYKILVMELDLHHKEAEFYDDLKKDYEYSKYSRDKYWKNLKLELNALEEARVTKYKMDSIKLHFLPQSIGWQVKHRFRAKNLAGNLGIHEYLFIVDKEYKKVLKSKDLLETDSK